MADIAGVGWTKADAGSCRASAPPRYMLFGDEYAVGRYPLR
ncbi:MAG: hypothetical protein R3F14_26185 [Polyangiaceae bacterium]